MANTHESVLRLVGGFCQGAGGIRGRSLAMEPSTGGRDDARRKHTQCLCWQAVPISKCCHWSQSVIGPATAACAGAQPTSYAHRRSAGVIIIVPISTYQSCRAVRHTVQAAGNAASELALPVASLCPESMGSWSGDVDPQEWQKEDEGERISDRFAVSLAPPPGWD